jgi:hypothetical protein
VPCDELLPLCMARCCQLGFALNTQDLSECEVRWDYLDPYAVLRRTGDRYCVHNDVDSKTCELYERRPLPCRKFDCRDDQRIWSDFEKRELAPLRMSLEADLTPDQVEEVHRERDSERRTAMACEEYCLEGLRGLRKPE